MTGGSGPRTTLYCPYCGAKVVRDNFCPTCRRTFVDPPTDQPHQNVVPVESERRNPILAAILSLIGVGLGQFYNGESAKGAAFMVMFFGVLLLAHAGYAVNPVLILPLILIVAMYDSFTSSRKINQREKVFHKKSFLFWPVVGVLVTVVVAAVIIIFSPHIAAHAVSFAAGAVAGTNYPQYSVPLYNTALAFSPNDIGILMDRATTLHNLGRTSDAVASLDRIEMIDPNNTAPVVMKGDILFQDGQYEESIGYFEKALSMNRNNAQVWIREGDANLALSIIEMGKIRKQYQNLTSEYNQPSAATDASTMDAFRSTESYQEAVKDYNEAIRIDPFTSVEISGRILSSTQSLLTTYQGILDDINQQNASAGSGKPS